ncbi:hypothetical protein RND71_003631 [Anisodus tanguticus]|uniref:Uncharacterized protein n=1 Tax=Anisodus tanguticus TaxID=243964 RepID=A0AAE1VX67_9SOLA|nr:hypothetical protein RND71_003631 [Anisodus tanguticus]
MNGIPGPDRTRVSDNPENRLRNEVIDLDPDVGEVEASKKLINRVKKQSNDDISGRKKQQEELIDRRDEEPDELINRRDELDELINRRDELDELINRQDEPNELIHRRDEEELDSSSLDKLLMEIDEFESEEEEVSNCGLGEEECLECEAPKDEEDNSDRLFALEKARPFLCPTIGEMEKDHIRNLIPYDDEEMYEGIDALREEIANATWINRPVEPRQ